eukprot:3162791-Prymnesium_polylepis.1
MSEVLDAVDRAMQRLKEEPELLLDPDFDIFTQVAEEVPEFAEWRRKQLEKTVLAEDNVTTHHLHREVLREARSPTPGSGNAQAHDVMLDIIKAQATRALEKLYDKKIALADKLTSQDGINSFGRNADAHARTQKAHMTNDSAENKFGIADHVMRTHRHISIINAAGIVQQRGAGDFDRPLPIVSDRRKRKATTPEPTQQLGFFWRLSAPLRAALVRVARSELPKALKVGRAERRSHDEEKLKRREESLNKQLGILVERYAEAKELYDQWCSQGIADKKVLTARLKELSMPQQIRELRRQIEMRTLGLGWTQFSTKWGFFSDETQHTWQKLHTMLVDDIFPHELALRRRKQLPTEAAPPQLKSHVLKSLGTADADALRIEAAS